MSAVNLLENPIFRIDDIEVSPVQRSARRGEQDLGLRAKTFDLLVYFLHHPGRLIPKEELIEHLWPDTSVTENSLVQCIIELRKALADDARNPRYIRTVTKSGYQFIATVQSELAAASEVPIAPQELPAWWRWKQVRWSAAVIVLLAAVAGIVVWRTSAQRLLDTTLPQIAGRRPVVVLFFDNQSHSSDLDWMREGLADMIIANLSRSQKLSVLSRQQLTVEMDRTGRRSANAIRLEDAVQVAQRTKANAFVLGSFAKLGESIRITAQVHEAASGRLLGAESITVDHNGQILAQMDVLALKLASRLGAPFERTERKTGISSLMTNNLEAYRDYSLAIEKAVAFHQEEAIALLEKAIALDPKFAMAYARLGYTYAVTWLRPELGRTYLEKAFQLSERLSEHERSLVAAWYAIANQDYPQAVQHYRALLAADPAETDTYTHLGMLLRGEERYQEAIDVLQRGLAVDAEAANIVNVLGGIYSQLGRHNEAIAMEQRYVTLAPRESNAHDSLGLAYQWAGRYDDAEQSYVRAMQIDPQFVLPLTHLAKTYYMTGRFREAQKLAQRFVKAAPSTVQRADGWSLIALCALAQDNLPAAKRAWEEAARATAPEAEIGILVALAAGDRRTVMDLSLRLDDPIMHGNRGARAPVLRERNMLRGEIALLQAQPETAITHFREALKHWSVWSTPAILEDCLADAFLRLGRLDEAIAEYQRALKLFPGLAMARYHLATIYTRQGRMNLARPEYREFLRLWSKADADLPVVIDAKRQTN